MNCIDDIREESEAMSMLRISHSQSNRVQERLNEIIGSVISLSLNSTFRTCSKFVLHLKMMLRMQYLQLSMDARNSKTKPSASLRVRGCGCGWVRVRVSLWLWVSVSNSKTPSLTSHLHPHPTPSPSHPHTHPQDILYIESYAQNCMYY